MIEHGLAKVIASDAMVVCKCGSAFDGYGTKGALNKWGDHMEANGLPVDMSYELATMHTIQLPSLEDAKK